MPVTVAPAAITQGVLWTLNNAEWRTHLVFILCPLFSCAPQLKVLQQRMVASGFRESFPPRWYNKKLQPPDPNQQRRIFSLSVRLRVSQGRGERNMTGLRNPSFSCKIFAQQSMWPLHTHPISLPKIKADLSSFPPQWLRDLLLSLSRVYHLQKSLWQQGEVHPWEATKKRLSDLDTVFEASGKNQQTPPKTNLTSFSQRETSPRNKLQQFLSCLEHLWAHIYRC